ARKDDLAIWLVRGMGLSVQAGLRKSASLSFADAGDITAASLPYIAFLTEKGIVTGDDSNQFLPASKVQRAVMAAMLSRAAQYLETSAAAPELPELTDYTFAAGVVQAVEETSAGLTVTLSAGGTEEDYAVPASAAVYQDGLLAGADAVASGFFARLRYDDAGAVARVDLYTKTTVAGTVSDASETSVTVNGTAYAIGRLTQVTAGGKTGDGSLIDGDVSYRYAVCLTDAAGSLLSVTLTGAETQSEGLVSVYYDTLYLTGIDNVTRPLETTSSTTCTVDGKTAKPAALDGLYATVTLDASDGTVSALTADTDTTWVSGVYRALTASGSETAIQFYDPLTQDITIYLQVTDGCTVTYEGASTELSVLSANAPGILTLQDGKAATFTAYSATGSFTGTVSSVRLGDPILVTLDVDGDERVLVLSPEDLPTVKLDGSTSTVDRIAAGDEVTVTVSSGVVSSLATSAATTEASGTAVRIVYEVSGAYLYLADEDGDETAYRLAGSYTVQYGTKTVDLTAVLGGEVTLTLAGGKVTGILLTAYATGDDESASGELSGTVLFVNTAEKYLLVETASGTVTVNVTSSTKYLDTGGSTLSLSSVKALDKIQAYGTYSVGTFSATLVLVL
ncbi:MAG TPA: S-layer homology domain-containing protein, partial [Oscillospiraceae bacterium]|nr:S-layer homology domain-containing protein [Oscillospiraceae bacterium]